MAREARESPGEWRPASAAPSGTVDVFIDLSSPCSGTPFREISTRETDGGVGGRPVFRSATSSYHDDSRTTLGALQRAVDARACAIFVPSWIDGSVASGMGASGVVPSPCSPSADSVGQPALFSAQMVGAISPCCDVSQTVVAVPPLNSMSSGIDGFCASRMGVSGVVPSPSPASPCSPFTPTPTPTAGAVSPSCGIFRTVEAVSRLNFVSSMVSAISPLCAESPIVNAISTLCNATSMVGAISPLCVESPMMVGAISPLCDSSLPSCSTHCVPLVVEAPLSHVSRGPLTGMSGSASLHPTACSAACAAFDAYLVALVNFWVQRAGCPSLSQFDLSSEAMARFATALPFVSAESLGVPVGASLDGFVERALSDSIAQRFGCRAISAGGTDGAALVALVLRLACGLAAGGSFRLLCRCSFDYRAARQRPVCHCLSLIGAATLLCDTLWAAPPPTGVPIMCGDWSLASIAHHYHLHPCCSRVVAELASFSWPIVSIDELDRLLALPHAAPTVLVGCEYSAALRSSYERHGFIALSVDLRDTAVPGLHARLGLESVWDRTWAEAVFHPPCTHLVLSDRRPSSYLAKRADGRTWWGLAFFVKCYCVQARRLAVEQPDTIISDLLHQPSQRLLPSFVGDDDRKPINLFTRGRHLIPLLSSARGASNHREPWEFEDADARDRWRSDWRRYPKLCDALVTVPSAQLDPAPRFEDVIEDVAAAFWDRGWPLPPQYARPLPPTLEEQVYQRRRGKG